MRVRERGSAGAREYPPAPRSVMINKGSTGIAIDIPGELAGLVLLVRRCVGVLVGWCVGGFVCWCGGGFVCWWVGGLVGCIVTH